MVLCSEGLGWNQNSVSNYRAIVLFILIKQTKGMVQGRSSKDDPNFHLQLFM